ncbi:hypothetical protein K0M31_018556 [Melipona bicolor]|uniref:Uncharacterized protein n=1 Tax=Melipona bicolor TaxID=60889 RepID=A0AA40G4K7_9HYME|nr:hypothetical protein K0M31_018556 [Melipona bicolor]
MRERNENGELLKRELSRGGDERRSCNVKSTANSENCSRFWRVIRLGANQAAVLPVPLLSERKTSL